MKAIFYANLRIAAVVTALLLITAGAGALIAFTPVDPKPDAGPEPLVVAVDALPASQTAPESATQLQPQPPLANASGLDWDSVQKEYKAGPGEGSVVFSFSFTNTSPAEVVINRVRPGCGCTTTRDLPALPWPIAAGASDHVEFVMNLAGRSGTVLKPVVVETSAGSVSLMLRVEIPAATNTNGAFTVRK